MVEHYGGTHIDGREPNINWFQIWISDVDEETTQTLEQKSYVTNLSRMKNIFMVGSKIKSTSVGNIFTKYLKRFYDNWIKLHQLSLDKITQYSPNQYPIAEDFIDYLNLVYVDIVEEFVKKDIYTILTALETMIETYGDIFNVRSTFSLEGKKLVAFNLESLLKADTNIYNAQYLNLFYMSFSHAVKIGQREKFLYDSGEKGIDEIEFTEENIAIIKRLASNGHKRICMLPLAVIFPRSQRGTHTRANNKLKITNIASRKITKTIV